MAIRLDFQYHRTTRGQEKLVRVAGISGSAHRRSTRQAAGDQHNGVVLDQAGPRSCHPFRMDQLSMMYLEWMRAASDWGPQSSLSLACEANRIVGYEAYQIKSCIPHRPSPEPRLLCYD